MKKKKNVMYRKSVSLLAAAAMTAVLMTGQVYPVFAEIGNIETKLETSSLIPDNVTIDQPITLSQITLPKSDYGTLSWVDGEFIPDKRVQACDVIFKPAENIDLSYLPGWDTEKKVVKGTINVVVSSLEDSTDNTQESSSDDNKAEDSGEIQTPEESIPTETPIETPTEAPTETPTEAPAETPTEAPTEAPAETPAETPTEAPTEAPAETPAETPTEAPTEAPAETPVETPAEELVAEAPATDDKDASAENVESAKTDEVQNQTEDQTVDEAPAEDTGENTGGILNETLGELMPGATVLDDVKADEDAAEEPEKGTGEETKEETKEDAPSDEKNIFDNPVDFTVSDGRPSTAEEGLTEEQQAERAAENHTCEGITVSGIDLPWYVQFQVESGENYEFKNEGKANIFQSYEFKLWDLRNNTEYEIPDGQYVSVTIPVKEGYEYSIEHLLANGATETIVPSVNGSTMVFSTHSFSPFGIAGFRPIIGDEIANGAYGENGTPTPTPTAAVSGTPTPSPAVTGTAGSGSAGTNVNGGGTAGNEIAGAGTDSANAGNNNGGTVSGTVATDNAGTANTSGSTNTSDSSQGSNTQNTSGGNASNGTASADNSSVAGNNGQSSGNTANGSAQTSNAVKTGDETTILPFVILLMAAVAAITAVFSIRRKEN